MNVFSVFLVLTHDFNFDERKKTLSILRNVAFIRAKRLTANAYNSYNALAKEYDHQPYARYPKICCPPLPKSTFVYIQAAGSLPLMVSSSL